MYSLNLRCLFTNEYTHVLSPQVLVAKTVLDEVMESFLQVATNMFGRKVFLHLLAPNSTKYFHPNGEA